ncbi:ATP-binding cassette domain-containing protein [Bacillus hwajinpoensis]|uniref:ATP-binding cassette domain-containing protein n=1 Tax=Guptibacillus hwajinpoensis TaxID=208199 RepID=A0A845F0K2_9BACL|nr:ABC transporter ATP-binding protein [Pseudalkalibacillus hwajinpoensis]MYL64274.1 ATP-binding cassette domain-containing protein [Pseudalkalibacillus hwajinpoensis]
MIEVNGIEKSFGNNNIIRDVSFSVKAGSIYGLLGSNGAGKTTIMRMIAGILRQDKGGIYVLNEQVDVSIKQRMVFIPDILYFLPQYTMRQLANYYASFYENWDEERYKNLTNLFHIDENKKVSHFSKGLQRQVIFILSLSVKPDVLILDEPFDGLDAVVRKKVRSLIIQDVAEREMSVLLSSHNLREVEEICDHVGILHQGEILLERDLDELKEDVHKVQVAFKDSGERLIAASDLEILYKEKRGSVLLLIVKGDERKVMNDIEKFGPVLMDRLPLTLEEIFIYEMEGVGYAIENIILI